MPINNAFFAKQASDELVETLFFGGFDYKREKIEKNGKKTYVYTTPNFVMSICGRNIQINNEKYTRVSDAKRRLQSLID